MSRWKENFAEHPIHATFNQIFDAIDNPQNTPHSGDFSEVRRLRKIISILHDSIMKVDVEIFPSSSLDDLDITLKSHYLAQLVNYKNDSNINAYIAPLNDRNDLVIHPLFAYSIGYTKNVRQEELENIYDKLTLTSNELKKSFQISTNNLKSLDKESEVVNKKFKSVTENMNNIISTWQTQFSEAETKRNEVFNASQTGNNSSFLTQQEENSKIFSENEKARNSEFSSWQEQKNNDLSNYIQNFKTSNEAKLQSIIDDSNEKNRVIKELYGIVADNSVTGGYAKVAKEEKTQFIVWKVLSFLFLVGAIVWISYLSPVAKHYVGQNIEQTTENKANSNAEALEKKSSKSIVDFTWGPIIYSTSVTFIFLFGVYFCSQQSTKHRDELRRAMRLELQIRALDPYIYKLSETEKLAIKRQLVDKFFIGVENFDTKETLQTPAGVVGNELIEKLKSIIEGASSAGKKA